MSVNYCSLTSGSIWKVQFPKRWDVWGFKTALQGIFFFYDFILFLRIFFHFIVSLFRTISWQFCCSKRSGARVAVTALCELEAAKQQWHPATSRPFTVIIYIYFFFTFLISAGVGPTVAEQQISGGPLGLIWTICFIGKKKTTGISEHRRARVQRDTRAEIDLCWCTRLSQDESLSNSLFPLRRPLSNDFLPLFSPPRPPPWISSWVHHYQQK